VDYVYICRQGKNEELRYSLRSLENNMPQGNVWIFGYRPEWYVGNFIKVEDIGGKFDNIRNCIKKIVENKDVSDDFVLMNDDFFALQKINKIVNYHGGYLKDKIVRYKESKMSPKYIRLLELTFSQLLKGGISNPIDYDIHVPITMNKRLLSDALDLAFFPRSSYGNLVKLDAKNISDVKIYSRSEKINWGSIIKNDFVSTEDRSFLSLKENVLVDMFNTPSKFENPIYINDIGQL
jgi:hypothetical protein